MNQSELKEYLLSNIEKVNAGYKTPCWEWQGRKDDGYGVFKQKKTHRLSAMIFLDFDLDSPLCVLHHCDNPPCINPDHLFIGTRQDNAADRDRKGRGEWILGYKHTKEAKKKMSKSAMGNTYRLGKKHTEETKRKISEIKMGNTGRIGCKHTEETKSIMSISQKERRKRESQF